jgi:PEP-CTERM motif
LKNIKTYLAALPLLLGFLCTAPVQAAAINWTLHDVTFDDGGTASGIFSADSATGGLLSYDITTTQGSTLLNGMNYTDNNSSFSDLADGFAVSRQVLVPNFPSSPSIGIRNFFLRFDLPLNLPGINPLNTQHSLEGIQLARHVTGGFASSVTAVPEPETYSMMLAGLGLLGFAARRRKQAQAA